MGRGFAVPRRADARGQGGIRDDPAVPDTVDQFILADDSPGPLGEINQQIKHLRLDIDALAAAADLAQRLVDLDV